MIRLAFKNVCKITKNSFGLIVLLLFTQIISGIALLFTYGVYENYLCEKNDDKLHSRENVVSFESGIDGGKIIETVDMIRQKLPEIVQTVNLRADIKDDTEIYAVCNYVEPEEYYMDISGKESVTSGRFFTDDEMRDGKRVALTYRKGIEACDLKGEKFDIIGYMESRRYPDFDAYLEEGGKDIYYIPFYSIPEEAILREITFYASRILSEKEENAIKQLFNEIYGDAIQYQAGTIISIEGEENSKRNILLSVFVSALGGFNLIAILGYIYNKRKKYYSITHMLGAVRIKMFFMTVFEVLIITLIASLTTQALYIIILEPVLEKWYTYFEIIYSAKVYMYSEILFIAVAVIAGCILAGANVKRCELAGVRSKEND